MADTVGCQKWREYSGAGKGAGPSGGPKKEEEKREEIKFDPITAESLRSDKGFAKANKKLKKEFDVMKKKHVKVGPRTYIWIS